MAEETVNNTTEETAAVVEAIDPFIAGLPENMILSHEVGFEHTNLIVSAENIVPLLKFLRDDTNYSFKQLIDVFGVDYPERVNRFEIIYQLLSFKLNRRLTIKILSNEDAIIPSVCEVFSAANWLEREVWDMYGIRFSNHPDLRRILTDYGFNGHPLRKDFPLTGYVEVRYDIGKARVVYEPVKLAQDFRNFDFLSPWEGNAEYVLPGDEKAKK